eukprot:745709-Hanusia_phi.AAC.1
MSLGTSSSSFEFPVRLDRSNALLVCIVFQQHPSHLQSCSVAAVEVRGINSVATPFVSLKTSSPPLLPPPPCLHLHHQHHSAPQHEIVSHIQIPVSDRSAQRRDPLLVCRVHVRSTCDQQPRNRNGSEDAGEHERRLLLSVPLLHTRAPCDQNPHDLFPPHPRRHMHSTPAVGLACAQVRHGIQQALDHLYRILVNTRQPLRARKLCSPTSLLPSFAAMYKMLSSYTRRSASADASSSILTVWTCPYFAARTREVDPLASACSTLACALSRLPTMPS